MQACRPARPRMSWLRKHRLQRRRLLLPDLVCVHTPPCVRPHSTLCACAQVLEQMSGIPTAHYHAGMTPKQRLNVQNDWRCGIVHVVVSSVDCKLPSTC
eukprot:364197-Chlamydomonas_euryale.AAC.11